MNEEIHTIRAASSTNAKHAMQNIGLPMFPLTE
jgi:hypothetical protein